MKKNRIFWNRVAELGSLSSGAKMAMKIFCQTPIYNFRVKCVSFARNRKGAHPCTSSSGQGGGKRVLEDFF